MSPQITWAIRTFVVGATIMFVAGTAFLATARKPAFGHGAAAWIMEKDARDPETNLSCCGKDDCKPVPGSEVSIVPGGFYLKQTGETIPYHRALESQDGQYWRCEYQIGNVVGKTRCFFKVEPGM
jgi:hypothetical protein